LLGSLLGVGDPGVVAAVSGGFLWLGWTALYFVVFWTVGGQTPGARLLGVRVVSERGGGLGVVRALLRFVVMLLALVPLGAGFVTVLFDDRRRGPHDMVAGTVARWVSVVSAGSVTVTATAVTAAASVPAPRSTTAGATAPGAVAGATATAPGAVVVPAVGGSIEPR
jgi:uncharacterized RDD family membrane protein YckC